MTNRSDPLEEGMISDLSLQLDRAVRPFDAAAVARRATGGSGRSVLRIVGATAVVAIAAVTTVVALEAVTGAGNQGAPGASASATSAPTGLPAAGLDQLASIQRADLLINSRLTPEEHAIIGNAQEEVIETCMQELGWDFELGTHSAETSFEAWPSTLSQLEQWMFADVALAESAGYGLESYLAEHYAFLETLDELEGGEARIPDQLTMSPEDAARYEVEYFGTEEERIEIVERDGSGSGIAGGGCLGGGFRAVYGDDLERWRWLDDARGTAQADIWEATFAAEAVGGALGTWRGCVRDELGMELEDPHAAFDAAMNAAQSGDYERERAVATADARCKVESRLDLAVQAAFLAATNAMLPEFEDDLVALQEFEGEALARAKEILGRQEDAD